jgi:hypothetical protein
MLPLFPEAAGDTALSDLGFRPLEYSEITPLLLPETAGETVPPDLRARPLEYSDITPPLLPYVLAVPVFPAVSDAFWALLLLLYSAIALFEAFPWSSIMVLLSRNGMFLITYYAKEKRRCYSFFHFTGYPDRGEK